MPEHRSMNMSGIDDFDSVISDRTVNDMEDFKNIVDDLENLEIKNSYKPRELPHNSIDLIDDSVNPTNTEEVKRLWREGEKFIAKEHTQIIVQAQVHSETFRYLAVS